MPITVADLRRVAEIRRRAALCCDACDAETDDMYDSIYEEFDCLCQECHDYEVWCEAQDRVADLSTAELIALAGLTPIPIPTETEEDPCAPTD
jgi:hypothetical protein